MGRRAGGGSRRLHALPLRVAAAQAGAWLPAQGAARLGLPADQLHSDGDTWLAPDGRCLPMAKLVAGGHAELLLDLATPTKPPADYTVVGTSAARVDLTAKATGAAVYVHDVRRPGMLHGRVVRPP